MSESEKIKFAYGYVQTTNEMLKEIYEPTMLAYLQDGEKGIYLLERKENETIEEWRARKIREREEITVQRSLERKSTPLVELTVETLLARMRMNKEFAEHYVQSYCSCDPFPDSERGDYKCPHAYDLELKSGLE